MLIVRPALAEEASVAEAVSRLAFLSLRNIYRPSKVAVALKKDGAPEYATLVGEYKGRIMATVEYRVDSTGLHVRWLAVDPAFQRRGFARRIVEGLTDIARGQEPSKIILYAIRETGNVLLFERLGFHVVGETVACWCESDLFDVLHEIQMERSVV